MRYTEARELVESALGQLDELKKSTYANYINKAAEDIRYHGYDTNPSTEGESQKKIEKRLKGIRRATKALGGRSRKVNEEVRRYSTDNTPDHLRGRPRPRFHGTDASGRRLGPGGVPIPPKDSPFWDPFQDGGSDMRWERLPLIPGMDWKRLLSPGARGRGRRPELDGPREPDGTFSTDDEDWRTSPRVSYPSDGPNGLLYYHKKRPPRETQEWERIKDHWYNDNDGTSPIPKDPRGNPYHIG